ncbi:MAG TPA: cupin domain-containing protein [Chloroflexia bacterium]|nr:cupin domain-containing protein [Chloroflexia bacterium]
MIVKDLQECEEFVAGDETHLREIFHPDKEPLSISYSLAHAFVRPGETSLPHKLRTAEVYYILEGTGEMHVDGASAQVGPGHAIYVPPLALQHIRNTGDTDLMFLCIVDPAWRAKDEEVL